MEYLLHDSTVLRSLYTFVDSSWDLFWEWNSIISPGQSSPGALCQWFSKHGPQSSSSKSFITWELIRNANLQVPLYIRNSGNGSRTHSSASWPGDSDGRASLRTTALTSTLSPPPNHELVPQCHGTIIFLQDLESGKFNWFVMSLGPLPPATDSTGILKESQIISKSVFTLPDVAKMLSKMIV